MVTKKKFYNEELDTTDLYTEVWLLETVRVKDVDDLLVENHYWRDSEGELWSDFNNPMENVKRSFDAYRKRKGYMTPHEIRTLRENLGLSVREFADELGIASSTLTQIENNRRVQVKYQEKLFRSAERDYRNGTFHKMDSLKTTIDLLNQHLATSIYVSYTPKYKTIKLSKFDEAFKLTNFGGIA